MIGPDSYQWLNSPTIMPRMLAPVSLFSSSTADIILGFLIKKILILAQNQEPPKTYTLSSENWWPFVNKTSTTHKSFKNEPIKKGQVNDIQLEFEAGNNQKYEVNGIWDSTVYAMESAGQLPGLYYLVSWKSYPEKENIWEHALAIQHLWRLVTVYYKDNPEKPTAISAPFDTAPPMARLSALPRPIAKPITDIPIKRKQGQPAKSTTTKQAKKS